MFGVLNLNKPRGCTSRDVDNQVQRLLRGMGYGRKFKLGHAGTLDPLADGVLVVCLGPATRLISYVQQMPKRYVGTFLLGQRSASLDIETVCQWVEDAPQPSYEEIVAKLPQFLGDIEQIPPKYSAVKVAGRRAYDLARRGAAVEIKPRTVSIHDLQVIRYDYPVLELAVECGSGTYVRSLGRDLAIACGTDGVMSALTRTAIGKFTIEDAVAPDMLCDANLSEHLLPAVRAVAHLPQVVLSKVEVQDVRQGKRILGKVEADPSEIAAFDCSGTLVALLTTSGTWLAPKSVFIQID